MAASFDFVIRDGADRRFRAACARIPLNLKSLKIFCDIVSRRSFSKAAADNGVSQSSASQVVGQLEAHLGVRLIDRSTRPLSTTPEGRSFYDGSRKIIAAYDALEDQVRTLHEEVAGRVRVAAIYSVGLHHMSRYVQEFMSRHPKANVRLEYLHPDRVLESVEQGQADVGIVSYPRSTRTIEAEPWREEPIVLVCAPGNPFAGRVEVSLGELHGQRLVAFDSDLVIRHELDRALAAGGAEPVVVMEFDNIETIKRAVEIDAGVALLPEQTVGRELAAGTLSMVRLSGEDLVRPLGIIHARGKPLAPTVQRFVELLRGHAHDLDATAVGAATAAP
jgi:DNA-binding transcriptional LysR family regulator